jgi:hypothetical protein
VLAVLTARRRRRLGLVVRALDFLSGPERIVRGQAAMGLKFCLLQFGKSARGTLTLARSAGPFPVFAISSRSAAPKPIEESPRYNTHQWLGNGDTPRERRLLAKRRPSGSASGRGVVSKRRRRRIRRRRAGRLA